LNFSFVFKTIILSLFVFILIYALSFSSVQQDIVSSNNFGVKNTTKEALNLGDLRVYDVVTFNDEILLNSTINNYVKNNNIQIDNVKFDIAVNDNIVTVRINTNKNLFSQVSSGTNLFSYKVERSSWWIRILKVIY